MVVGTYRDTDLSREHPLTALLADLHREQVGERIKLAGLESERRAGADGGRWPGRSSTRTGASWRARSPARRPATRSSPVELYAI